MKIAKTILVVFVLVFGYLYLVVLCYQSGALLGLESPTARFILANFVIYGWLSNIYAAIKFLKKARVT